MGIFQLFNYLCDAFPYMKPTYIDLTRLSELGHLNYNDIGIRELQQNEKLPLMLHATSLEIYNHINSLILTTIIMTATAIIYTSFNNASNFSDNVKHTGNKIIQI